MACEVGENQHLCLAHCIHSIDWLKKSMNDLASASSACLFISSPHTPPSPTYVLTILNDTRRASLHQTLSFASAHLHVSFLLLRRPSPSAPTPSSDCVMPVLGKPFLFPPCWVSSLPYALRGPGSNLYYGTYYYTVLAFSIIFIFYQISSKLMAETASFISTSLVPN